MVKRSNSKKQRKGQGDDAQAARKTPTPVASSHTNSRDGGEHVAVKASKPRSQETFGKKDEKRTGKSSGVRGPRDGGVSRRESGGGASGRAREEGRRSVGASIWNPNVEALLELGKQKKSTTKATLPAEPQLELQRLRKAKKLRNILYKACKASGVKVPLLCFERWLSRCKLHEGQQGGGTDPLLPSTEWLDVGLVRDLTRGKMSESRAREVVSSLTAASVRAVEGLVSEAGGAATVTVERKASTVQVSCGGSKPYIAINKSHYDKLRRLFQRFGASGESDADTERSFHSHLWCLLARYEALSGHGYQAALCEAGFDVLRSAMTVDFECFASPLNCHYGRHCSAFPDTDTPFGSLGSFFRFRPRSGSFEANPPFVPEVMSAMVGHMEKLLTRAAGPLSFTVIIPAWEEVLAWRQLTGSKFCRQSWRVPAVEHGYCDGAQHNARFRYRPSSFDTSVIFLQNDAAAQKWPVTEQLKQDLCKAMRTALPRGAPTIEEYEKRIRGGAKRLGASNKADAAGKRKRQKRDDSSAPLPASP